MYSLPQWLTVYKSTKHQSGSFAFFCRPLFFFFVSYFSFLIGFYLLVFFNSLPTPGQHINTQPKNSNSSPETQCSRSNLQEICCHAILQTTYLILPFQQQQQQHSGQLIYLTRLFETESFLKTTTNVAESENNSRFKSTWCPWRFTNWLLW